MKTAFLTKAITKKNPNASGLQVEALKGQINDPELTLKTLISLKS